MAKRNIESEIENDKNLISNHSNHSKYSKIIFPNGVKFEGQFKNGELDGFAIQDFPDYYRFEGDFVNGKRNGYGVEIYKNGFRFEGHYKNDKRNGFGVIINPLVEQTFEGIFKDNKRVYGLITFDDGHHWEIKYRSNKKYRKRSINECEYETILGSLKS